MKKTPDNTGKTYKDNVKVIDPKVMAFKQAYLDSTNETTFCNIYRSALQAGYSHTYAGNLGNGKNAPKWYKEFKEEAGTMRAEMLAQAEKNLKKTLSQEEDTDTKIKLKHDATKFVSERLGKEHYSTRQEVTGKDGKRLFDIKDKGNETPLTELFAGVQATKAVDKDSKD